MVAWRDENLVGMRAGDLADDSDESSADVMAALMVAYSVETRAASSAAARVAEMVAYWDEHLVVSLVGARVDAMDAK